MPQGNDLKIRQRPAQFLKTSCVRATEAIDGLIGIADHKQRPPACAEVQYQLSLNGVNVLIFIHQQMPEHGLAMQIQLQRIQEQVIQIPRIECLQCRLIGFQQRRCLGIQAVFKP